MNNTTLIENERECSEEELKQVAGGGFRPPHEWESSAYLSMMTSIEAAPRRGISLYDAGKGPPCMAKAALSVFSSRSKSPVTPQASRFPRAVASLGVSADG
jgi:hypothetical protein